MDYLLFSCCIGGIVLILLCAHADFKRGMPPTPHEEPAEPTPELDPEVYNMALAHLLIEAELRGLEQVTRNQGPRRGDDEAGKGARI
jgi:hypothetical protein